MEEKSRKGTSHLKHLVQLKRIEGQVRGVIKMIEEQRYCIDILQQMKALRSSLFSIEKKILSEHLDSCVQKAFDSKKKKDSQLVVDEIKDLIKAVKF